MEDNEKNNGLYLELIDQNGEEMIFKKSDISAIARDEGNTRIYIGVISFQVLVNYLVVKKLLYRRDLK